MSSTGWSNNDCCCCDNGRRDMGGLFLVTCCKHSFGRQRCGWSMISGLNLGQVADVDEEAKIWSQCLVCDWRLKPFPHLPVAANALLLVVPRWKEVSLLLLLLPLLLWDDGAVRGKCILLLRQAWSPPPSNTKVYITKSWVSNRIHTWRGLGLSKTYRFISEHLWIQGCGCMRG